MSFDPTGYTSPMSICILISPALKTTWTAALISMRSFAEMNDLMTRGVRNVIEMTNRYMGRNAQFMLDVMRETGINVVACTGYYQTRFSRNMWRPAACRNWHRRWSMKLNRVSMARS